MRPPFLRSMLGGAVGTVLMTTMMYFVAPMMLGTSMDIADLLGRMIGGGWVAGMMAAGASFVGHAGYGAALGAIAGGADQ